MSHVRELSVTSFPLWGRMREQRRPLSFELEFTARCNNDCAHCYINLPAGDGSARRRELTPDEIGDIASQAADLGAIWCLMTGGEPLLREDFEDVYLLLREKGLLVSVFTNACLIRKRHVDLFRRFPPRNVEVTVYGVTRQTYEAVTGKPGSYDAFRRGLALLQEGSVKVRLKAVALRSNVRELDEIAAFCRSRTKDYFRFDPLLHLRLDGNEDRNRRIRAERLSPEEIVRIEGDDPERCEALLDQRDKFILPQAMGVKSCALFRCLPGQSSFTIGWDGMFRPCASLMRADCVADLRNVSLREAWLELVPHVWALETENASFVTGCGACPYFNLCLWCPAHAYLETGEMDGEVPYFCAVAKARAEFIEGSSPAEP